MKFKKGDLIRHIDGPKLLATIIDVSEDLYHYTFVESGGKISNPHQFVESVFELDFKEMRNDKLKDLLTKSSNLLQ